jgi:hypothetical protein
MSSPLPLSISPSRPALTQPPPSPPVFPNRRPLPLFLPAASLSQRPLPGLSLSPWVSQPPPSPPSLPPPLSPLALPPLSLSLLVLLSLSPVGVAAAAPLESPPRRCRSQPPAASPTRLRCGVRRPDALRLEHAVALRRRLSDALRTL